MKIAKKFLAGKKFIAKVQIPLMTTEVPPLAFVYNKDRDFEVFMTITEELLEVMGGEPKKYFHAHYDKKLNNTVLGVEASRQTW